MTADLEVAGALVDHHRREPEQLAAVDPLDLEVGAGATARSGRTSDPALAVGWLPGFGGSVAMPRTTARPTRVARGPRAHA